MDINSLLSPSEATASNSPSPQAASNKSRRKRAPTSVPATAESQIYAQKAAPQHVAAAAAAAAAPAPDPAPANSHRQLPAHIQIPPPASPSRQAPSHQQWSNAPSPASSSLSAGGPYSPRSLTYAHSAAATPPPMARALSHQRPLLHRAPTSGMDTLADLASMQQHQQTNSHRPTLPQRQISAPNANSAARPSLEHFRRAHSGSRGSIDMSMLDMVPKPQVHPVRNLHSASLTQDDLKEASQLFHHLHDNPHAYESHMRLIKTLRRGLRVHSVHEDTGESRQDPRTYELVKELQEANEAMGKLFAVGEELWLERLADQQLLAYTVEDCVAVMELCQKAVSEEPTSTHLWQLFGQWVTMIYHISHGIEAEVPLSFHTRFATWSPDDKTVAREAFSRQQIIEVWRRGSQHTEWNIYDGHLVWNEWIALLLEDLQETRSDQALSSLRDQFERRLQIPHSEWDGTFQQFYQFVSHYLQSSAYEQTMIKVKQMSQMAKLRYGDRENFEVHWEQAKRDGDKTAEGQLVSAYLEWELGRSRKKRGHFSFDLSRALYQRALLRFPLYTDLWEDFILFLADEAQAQLLAQQALPVIERAVRHCPWSGKIWSHYIRAGELVGLPFEDMSQVKHQATSKGLLDASPLEDHILINTSWCSYLRRRAFSREMPEEDELDVTEVGIRSAIEEMEVLGRSRHGNDYQGDPQYRLERIYIRFCTQIGDGVHIQTARDQWKKLVPRCGQGYEFWQWYFLWERFIWVQNPGGHNISPDQKAATNVLIQGLSTPDLDWPEKLVHDLLRHAEDYEDPQGQLAAIVAAHKARKVLEKRREQERLDAQRHAMKQEFQPGAVAAGQETDSALVGDKRKREVNDDALDLSHKRPRSSEPQEGDVPMDETNGTSVIQQKRDRENATITVKNLPAAVSEGRVRHFFRDCGEIISLKLVPEPSGTADEDSATAYIEFGSSEDGLIAQTRDMKKFEGRSIAVQVGSETTIYCANYPAAADDSYIRSLFEPFGHILEVRFPSLKYNTHRRFCYVQYSTSSAAKAAEAALDGREISIGEDDSTVHLVAKISDPSHKQARSGAIEDGREVYVGNLDWSASESELRSLFEKYGSIERLRIPRNMAGKSKGMAFVVFTDSEDAKKALELEGTKLRSRVIAVSIATKGQAKRTATTLVGRSRNTASPSPSAAWSASGEATMEGSNATAPIASREDIAARTIALLGVPDTVNDAHIRSISEKHGHLAKIILRPDHGGAIIEYTETSAAGKASMALEGYEIRPGRLIRVGTVQELMANKADTKSAETKVNAPNVSRAPDGATSGLGSGVIRRPVQGAGRRGGLGTKRGGGALPGRASYQSSAPSVKQENGFASEKESKSNADFRALVSKKDA